MVSMDRVHNFIIEPHARQRIVPMAKVIGEALNRLAFIIAAPQRQRGMVAQPRDLTANLGLDAGRESRVIGIGRASKHEVLPDQEP